MEEYYLIKKSDLTLIAAQLDSLSTFNNCGLTKEKSEQLLSFKTIDLSDEAIEENAWKYVRKINRDLTATHLKAYISALQDLKQTLNEKQHE